MELTVDRHHSYVYTGTRPLVAGRPTWLFVHGAGMDHSVWVLQSRYFAFHGCNVLAVDLPGHGRSGGNPATTVGAAAEWLVRVLDRVEVPAARIVGHSMGSLVALELAARFPERCDALALLGVASPMAVAGPLLDAARNNDPAAADMIVGWGHSARSALGGNPLPGLWLLNESRCLLQRAAPGVIYADLKACNDYTDGLSRAVTVRCPVRVIAGQGDRMTPRRGAQALLDALPAVDSVIIPGCGHMMMIEQPGATLDALRDFARQLNPGT